MKALNQLEAIKELKAEDLNHLIIASSFEERCFSTLSLLGDHNFDKILIFGTIDFNKKIKDNTQTLIKRLNSKAKEIISIDLKINQADYSFINIANACKNLFFGPPQKVLFDITTFTHEHLLMLLRVMMSYKRQDDVIKFIYSGAKSYSCDVKDDGEKWLSKGVKELRSIIGYPGYSDPTKKNHLVILFGFEVERTIKLIEQFDFDTVSLAFGAKDDSIATNHQKINEDRHEEVLKLIPNAMKFTLSLTDPYVAKQQILAHLQSYDQKNIVIAPMNNKLSTIGAGLAAIDNKEIQLCYLQANIYNISNYSEVSNYFFIID